MLPYEPEPLERLQARFPKALESVYDMRLVAKGWQAPAGERRCHVFDHDDGLRLIVSRDRLPVLGRARGEDAVYLHVSASFEVGWPLARDFAQRLRRDSARRVLARWFVPLVERRFAQFSAIPLVFHGFSPDQGVPHWFDAPLPQEVRVD